MKVNKSGRSHNLVPGRIPWGNFRGNRSSWGSFFTSLHILFTSRIWQNSYVEALCLCVVNDLATNNHTGLMYSTFVLLLTSNSDLTINQPKSSAAALPGLNSLASAPCVSPLLCSGPLQVNSRGYSSCSGLSMCVFPALSCAPLITPFRPRIRCSTTPIFHLPLLHSSSLISITSSSFKVASSVWWLRLWRSLRAFRYSVVHLFHRTSLHFRRYLARFRRT